MPITSSAKKAVRNSKRKAVFNSRRRKAMKSSIKELKGLIALKNAKAGKEFLSKVYQTLDKAVKTGLIKKNHASRKKSRLARALLKGIS
ncbi:MAG: 30S ribosomal protein S20 [Candidatus Vogelbacteria bacterium]|nr:30S ribosomal protein S20 [Candidatus Vogelbacteria bacterium]